MIQNDSSGKINGVGYIPGRRIVLVRNPNWDSKTDFRPAYADKIVFSEGFQDQTVMTDKILAGTGDVNGDSPPPATEMKRILSNPKLNKELFFTPAAAVATFRSTRRRLRSRTCMCVVPLHSSSTRKPCARPWRPDRRRHRHPLHRSQLHEEGLRGCGRLQVRPVSQPKPCRRRCQGQAELKLAATRAVCTKPALTMVADNTPPGSNTAKVIAADLAKIGMTVKIVSVTHPTMYTNFCMVPKKEPQICPNVGWLADFQEPQTLLDPTFNVRTSSR